MTEPWTPADRYQKQLSKLLQKDRPTILVETGHDLGTSAEWIARALDANNHGTLYSIEAYGAEVFVHPRVRFLKGLSYNVMLDLFIETGPWDCFLHDSDHGVACQTFEYEVAWHFVSQGGLIVTDDPVWGTPNPHHAWQQFCRRHNVVDLELGTARYFYKPNIDPPMGGDRMEGNIIIEKAKRLSNLAAVVYGDAPYFI